MRLERHKVLHSLDSIEVVEYLEHLDSIERRSWAFGCFFRFLILQKKQKHKNRTKKDIPFSCDWAFGSLFNLEACISKYNKLR